MPKLIWNDKFSVKIAEFDAQHKKLIEMLSELTDAMSVGKGKDVLGKILSSLVSYTQTHFAREEELMQKYGFAKLTEHRLEHQELTRQVVDIQKKFQAGSVGLTIPVLNFLNDWLTEHILQSDMQYSSFLNSKGIK